MSSSTRRSSRRFSLATPAAKEDSDKKSNRRKTMTPKTKAEVPAAANGVHGRGRKRSAPPKASEAVLLSSGSSQDEEDEAVNGKALPASAASSASDGEGRLSVVYSDDDSVPSMVEAGARTKEASRRRSLAFQKKNPGDKEDEEDEKDEALVS